MSFTYSVNTDGTVSNIQFPKTEEYGHNITCAQDVIDDLAYQYGLEKFMEKFLAEERFNQEWDEYNS